MTTVILALVLAVPAWMFAPQRGISDAAIKRYDAISKALSSDAKKKLDQSAHDLLVQLAPTPEGTDPAPAARDVVKRLFASLTPAQLDLVTFATLVDAGQKTVDVDVLDKMMGASAKNLSAAETHRLHHLLDDTSGYVPAIDKLLKKIAATPSSAVQSVK